MKMPKQVHTGTTAQENSYISRVFVILLACLILQGTELTREMYNQQAIYSRKKGKTGNCITHYFSENSPMQTLVASRRKVQIGLAHILLLMNQSNNKQTVFIESLGVARRRQEDAVNSGIKQYCYRNDSRLVPSGPGQIVTLVAAQAEGSPSINSVNKHSTT